MRHSFLVMVTVNTPDSVQPHAVQQGLLAQTPTRIGNWPVVDTRLVGGMVTAENQPILPPVDTLYQAMQLLANRVTTPASLGSLWNTNDKLNAVHLKKVISFDDIKHSKIIVDENGVYSEGLREPCPDCGDEKCDNDCEPQQNESNPQQVEQNVLRRQANSAIDAVESLVLSLHKEGVDITTPQMKSALETTLDYITNTY